MASSVAEIPLVQGNAVDNASVETLYTAPANTRVRITKADCLNTDNSNAVTLSVWLVASGGSPDATNQMWEDESFAPKEPRAVDPLVGHVLDPGDSIRAQASAAGINIRISGIRMTV